MPRVQLQDFKMHHVEQGAGDEVILFVHGFAASHRWGSPALERLPRSDHAYAIDLRACGDSEQVETGHTFAQYADDIHQTSAFAKALTPDYAEEVIADAAKWGAPVYMSTLREMWEFNVAGRLGEIKVPALVTWGDRDTAVPFVGIPEIYTGIAGCALEVWHGVGHTPPVEIPDRFVALLTQFIGEASAPRA